MTENDRIAQLEAQVAALQAELQPYRDEAKAAEERRVQREARHAAFMASLAAEPEPELTPEEEAEALKGFADMFRRCESCGLSRMSAVEDESCQCCHGCNHLRLVLRDVLQFYEHVDHPVIQKAWEEYHRHDPTDTQIYQIAHNLKRRTGLFAQVVTHGKSAGPFQHKEGWRLVVALRYDEAAGTINDKPFGVFVDHVTVKRPDPEKPLLMRVSMPRGNEIEEKDSESWYEVYEIIVDYYRGRGLIPAEDIWPT